MTMLRYTDRRASGLYVTSDPDAPHGLVDEGETLSCAHCQALMTIKPGSGRLRGFCKKCNGVVCGKKDCMEHCRPWEAQLEEIEKAARLNG